MNKTVTTELYVHSKNGNIGVLNLKPQMTMGINYSGSITPEALEKYEEEQKKIKEEQDKQDALEIYQFLEDHLPEEVFNVLRSLPRKTKAIRVDKAKPGEDRTEVGMVKVEGVPGTNKTLSEDIQISNVHTYGIPRLKSVHDILKKTKAIVNAAGDVCPDPASGIKFPAGLAPFKLQNRRRDSRWEDLEGELSGNETRQYDLAKAKAKLLSENSITFGMVRVLDSSGNVLVTFQAGSGEECN